MTWTSFASPKPFVTVLPANLAPLSLGMLLAVLSAWTEHRGESPRWLTAAASHPGRWWALAAVAWSATVWLVDYPVQLLFTHISGGQHFANDLLLTVVGFAIVLPVALGNQDDGLIRRILRSPVLVFLGTISFGIYLWHLPIMGWIRKTVLDQPPGRANFVLLAIITIAVTVVVAAVSWHVLEKPVMKWAHNGTRASRRGMLTTPTRSQ
jgi:peptidoglycan/LPS O-acetylase OafA/YrhL